MINIYRIESQKLFHWVYWCKLKQVVNSFLETLFFPLNFAGYSLFFSQTAYKWSIAKLQLPSFPFTWHTVNQCMVPYPHSHYLHKINCAKQFVHTFARCVLNYMQIYSTNLRIQGTNLCANYFAQTFLWQKCPYHTQLMTVGVFHLIHHKEGEKFQ